jgi:agmatine deiminase
MTQATPQQQGYFFPAEWHPQQATWFTVPHNDHSWQGEKLANMYAQYFTFISTVAKRQNVCLNVNTNSLGQFATEELLKLGVASAKIEINIASTNDAWCRDHGPAFLINKNGKDRLIIDWGYNAWGGKYPPFHNDNDLPKSIARHRGLDYVSPGIIMEGGSVDFNGAGTVLTTKSCLLNPNRNPHLNQGQIEKYLFDYYGSEQVLWLEEGIVGDDTDGHIDDITRFLNEDTVVTVVESNKQDDNYQVLQNNLKLLQKMRLANGKQLNVVELPMPAAVVQDDFRTPASYANFLICNAGVIVPIYNQTTDQQALDIIGSIVKDRPVIGLNSSNIIWGQGSFHCLSQQEPCA